MLSDPRSRTRAALIAALLLGMVLGAGVLRVAGGAGDGDDAARLICASQCLGTSAKKKCEHQ